MIDPAPGLATGLDNRLRCVWCGVDPAYTAYHDTEWGFAVDDDRALFEKLCLEGFQSGLSWLTILRKRDNFREAFADFLPTAVAEFGPADVERLLSNAGIVRHRGKIEATINNARRYAELVADRGSLAEFAWSFEPVERPATLDAATLSGMASTGESAAMSKELRRRGWAFVGPTTCYSFMQAMGIVNDHLEGCVIRPAAERSRSAHKARSRQ